MTASSPPSALSALILLAHYHGIAANPADILHRFSADGTDLSQTEWLLAAKELGLKAKRVAHKHIDRLSLLSLPAMVWCEDGRHFVLAKVDEDRFLIQDAQAGRPEVLSREDFAGRYSGELILVASRASVLGQLSRFDFTWFIPAVIKYRRILWRYWRYRW